MVKLLKGELWLEVIEKHGNPFRITTSAGDVVAYGTEFVVQVRERSKDMKILKSVIGVLVISGMVELTNNVGSEIAGSGEYLYAQQDSQPVKKPAQQTTPEIRYAKVFFWDAGEDWDGHEACLFDLDTRKWERIPDVPIQPRTGFSRALWRSKFFIWGGVYGEACSDGAIYDLQKRKWKVVPKYEGDASEDGIYGRWDHITHSWGSKVFIWGGQSTYPGRIWNGGIYDLKEEEWEYVPEIPLKPRENYCSIIAGSKVMIWGGYVMRHSRAVGDGAIYDIKKDEWKKLPKAPIKGRYNHLMVCHGSKVLIWGGTLEDGAIYDIQENKWQKLPRAPIKPLRSYAYTLFGSKLFIWGRVYAGINKMGEKVFLIDGAIYDFKKNSWESELLPDAPVKPGRFPLAYTVGSKIVVIRDKYSPLEGAIYDPVKETWQRLPNPPIDVTVGSFGCAFAYKSRLFVFKDTWSGMSFDPEKGKWEILPKGPSLERDIIVPVISR
jgi:hypothetical protein